MAPPPPFSDASERIAAEIIGRALDAMREAGLNPVEIGHQLICAGIEWLPAGCCATCLGGHYDAVIAAIEERIERIPTLREGVDIAISRGCLHG